MTTTTKVTQHMIENFKKAGTVVFEVVTDHYSNTSLKANGTGSMEMQFANDINSFTTVTTLGFPFVIDCKILIDGKPLHNIDETSVKVVFSGADLKFLGYLLEPGDTFNVCITIDNVMPVTTAKTQLEIFRNNKFMFDVTLPTQTCYNLEDVINYSFKQ